MSRSSERESQHPTCIHTEAMNAERLHALALAVLDDLSATNSVGLLKELSASLQRQVENPQDPAPQADVSVIRSQLVEALAGAPSNTYPPIWQQLLAEISGQGLLGSAMRSRIEATFQSNQITPSVAVTELRALQQEIAEFQNALTSIVASMQKLNVKSETLDAGQVELGILIPRPAVQNRLKEFGTELRAINAILAPFDELATGQRAGFGIRGIASSDLTVFLDVAPAVGACVAVAIERLVALYKQLLEIRKLREDLKQQGLPEATLNPINEHANALVSTGLDPIVDDLMKRFWQGHEKGRENELKVELRASLSSLANRIDVGYNFEVRTAPITTDSDSASPPSEQANLESIRNASQAMQFLKREGSPILRLPESVQGGDDPKESKDHGEDKGEASTKRKK